MTTATISESIVERRPLAWLREHPHNPRGPVVEDESLRELADSITAQGILQPLVATPDGVLLAGHRRAAAARLAGLSEAPVMLRDVDATQQLAVMLVENVQRNDLTPLQLARAMRQLREMGRSAADIARMTGKSVTWVHDLLRLGKLPADVMAQVEAGALSVMQGIELARFADRPEVLARLAEDTHRYGLTAAYLAGLNAQGQAPARQAPRGHPSAPRLGGSPQLTPPLTAVDRALLAGAAPMPVTAPAAEAERATVVAFLRRRAIVCGGAVRLAVSGLADEIECGAHVGAQDGEG